MKWNVECADARGVRRVMQVDAPSKGAAATQLRQQGYTVEEVMASSVHETPARVAPPKLPQQHEPAPEVVMVPNYNGLRTGAALLGAAAVLCYGAAAWWVLAALGRPSIEGTAAAGSAAVACFFAGAVAQTAGDAARALRDMARNSFTR